MILHLPSLDAAALAAYVPTAALGQAVGALAAFAAAVWFLRSNRRAELSSRRTLLGVVLLLAAGCLAAWWVCRIPSFTALLQHRYAPAAAAAIATCFLLSGAGMQLRRKAGQQPKSGRLLAGLLLSACASLGLLTAVVALVLRMP